jgi:hypothetical protein
MVDFQGYTGGDILWIASDTSILIGFSILSLMKETGYRELPARVATEVHCEQNLLCDIL